MKRKILVYLGVAVAAVAGTAAWLAAGGTEEVGTVQVQIGTIVRAVVDTGYVQAAANHDLYAAQSGRAVRVYVKVGQAVKKGDTLVVLENLDLAMQVEDTRSQLSQAVIAVGGARAAVDRAQAELRDAEENLARTQELFGAEAATQVELDKARLQVEVCGQSVKEHTSRLESALAQQAGLRQSLEQLEAKERQLVVRSPVSGTVLELPVKQDQVVAPGTLLATVAAVNQLEVKADILSDDLGEVKVGQSATVTAPVLGGKALEGRVTKIYPQAEEKTSALGVVQRRVPVIIALNDPANLKPGFEVRVAIETLTRQDVLVLPREAVRTTEDGRKEVMAVVDGQVRYRLVETGIADQLNVEIVSGLKAGDEIVRDGSLDLPENARVKTAETNR